MERKRKTVTYTGCWTCRSRRVKCDERKVGGCIVCEKAHLNCEGYDLNLTWTANEKIGTRGQRRIGRRAVELDHKCLPLLQPTELNDAIRSIDKPDFNPKDQTNGLFSVFSLGGNTEISRNDSNVPSERSPTLNETVSQPTGKETSSETESWEDDQSASLVSNLSLQVSSSSTKIQHHIDIEEENTFYDPLFKHQSKSSPKYHQIVHLGHEVSLPLFQDHETDMLMHHYANIVTDLLQPVTHPKNPWRRVYIPIALEGSTDLMLARNPGSTSLAARALFHSLLSAAAFHLRGQDSSGRIHALAVGHNAKAVSLTLAALNEGDSCQYQVTMTAILSLVTADMIAGDSDYWIHLGGGNRLRASRNYATTVSHSTTQLNEMCAFLSMIARTTDYTLPPLPWTDGETSGDPHIYMGKQPNYEFIYGIAPTTTNGIYQTCRLSQHLAFYQDQPLPDGLLLACEQLGDKLNSWNVENETFETIDSTSETMMAIARSHARAFHNATLIYYYRAIQNCHPSKIMSLVQSVADDMHTVEDLKDWLVIDRNMGPILWPAFIASCEAVERESWRRYWSRVQKYRMGNFRNQWNIVETVWREKDLYGAEMDFREILRRKGIRILPI